MTISAESKAATGISVTNSFIYARYIGCIGFTVQFVVMSIRSWHEYKAFALSSDFGIFYNAWIQISHGTLTPFNDQLHCYFWQSHFELIMWPLALFGLITKSGYFLLTVQNIGYAGAGTVAYLWACDVCNNRVAHHATNRLTVTIALVTTSIMVLNPWIYIGAGYDFHFQSLSTLLALLTGRSFYLSRPKQAFVFLILTLMSGDVGCTYMCAISVSLFLLRPIKRSGAYVSLALSIGWLALITVLNANQGSYLDRYTWLLGHHVVVHHGASFLIIAAGAILLHPLRVIKAFLERDSGIYDRLAPVGGMGVLTALALPLSLLILFENTLNNNNYFWSPSFQDTPLIVLSGAGVVTISWRIGTLASRWRLFAYPVLLVITLNALWFDTHRTPPLQHIRLTKNASEALGEAYSRMRYNDQVVVSTRVDGRFAGRSHYVALDQLPEPVHVTSSRVFFILDFQEGSEQTLLNNSLPTTASYIRNTLRARPIVQTNLIAAYMWNPPHGTTTIELPGNSLPMS